MIVSIDFRLTVTTLQALPTRVSLANHRFFKSQKNDAPSHTASALVSVTYSPYAACCLGRTSAV